MRQDRNAEDPHRSESQEPAGGVSRRTVLRLGAAAGAGASFGLLGSAEASAAPELETLAGGFSIEEATIAELQREMAARRLRSRDLVRAYLRRIERFDQRGPGVNSILEVNPDALQIARDLDDEREDIGPRGPLHGIPVILKDNVDTADAMQTAAGSLALVGDPASQDATIAARLRAAGAVILGKANLSEWANFRSFHSSSGWSGRGGQCKNPYILDRNPCGSSSGSGASVSANFTTVSIGTETDGSIVCPSSACGVVGIKPTLGLTSRAGVVPLSHSQDVTGPHGRTVADAATVLGALVGVDPRDPATAASAGNFHTDYRPFLNANGLAGKRIGVMRNTVTGYSEETDAIFEAAIAAMAGAGATIVDPADVPTADELLADPAELIVLVYEFKRDLNAYLATRSGVPVASLADCIQFNLDNADDELPFFLQEWFDLAEADPFSESEYLAALERGPRLAGPEGIDAVMDAFDLDALVAPTGSPAWTTDLINGDNFQGASSTFAAVSGYPAIAVPAGSSFGLPVGVSFIGRRWSEPTLITVASGFEAVTRARRKPRFEPTLRGASPRALGGTRSASAAELFERLQRREVAPLRRRLGLL